MANTIPNKIDTLEQAKLLIRSLKIKSQLPLQEKNLNEVEEQTLDQNSQKFQIQNQIIPLNQKKITTQLDSISNILREMERLFTYCLEPSCPIAGLVSIQALGIYLQKEVELLKEIKQQKINIPQELSANELDYLYGEKYTQEINKILIKIRGSMLDYKIKYLKENMLQNDLVIYEYKNEKKINLINTKLEIDGEIIQKQLNDKLQNIKRLVQRVNEQQLKQINIEANQQQEIVQIHYHQYIGQLETISNRANILKTILENEYSKLYSSLQQFKLMPFDYLLKLLQDNNKLINHYHKNLKNNNQKYFECDITISDKDYYMIDLIIQQLKQINRISDLEQKINSLRECFQKINQLDSNFTIPEL